MSTTYTCDDCRRPVTAETIEEAAEIFAGRIARREYGKRRGTVAALRVDSWRQDGRAVHCEAFVGRHVAGGGVTGDNVRFTVRTA